LIYEFQDRPARGAAYNALRFELQIRTEMQHIWATAVEAVGLLTGQALKSNIGSKDWRSLFALTSSEMALREGLPPIRSLPVRESERVREIRELTEKLRAVETLKVAQAAIGFAADDPVVGGWGAGYFLVSYDYRRGTVQIRPFDLTASKKAYLAYAEAEKDQSQDTVLVSVDSIVALQQAYPNYFLNTQDFLKFLSETLER
jgi:hypothetical protein